jgi:hypothetical protein
MTHYLTYLHYGLSISPSQVYMSRRRQLPQFSTENKPVQTVLNGDINFNLAFMAKLIKYSNVFFWRENLFPVPSSQLQTYLIKTHITQ